MPVISRGPVADRDGIRVDGIYLRLLEHERRRVATPDPRWSHAGAERVGDAPPEFMQSSPWLADLEAGRPVELPVWRLGGNSEPDERIRRLKRGDREIHGWLVRPDDVVIPVREQGMGA